MKLHPKGIEHTARLVEMAGLTPPCRVLDMGAGDGDSVRYLRSLGFEAVGIDIAPGPDVERGDYLSCPWPDGYFGAVISECSFFLCGDRPAALREAWRLTAPGGLLLLSDVWIGTSGDMTQELAAAGFYTLCAQDATEDWKHYYIERIWDGTAVELPKETPAGRPRYYLTVSERETR